MDLKELKKIIDDEVEKGKEKVEFYVDCSNNTYELDILDITGFNIYPGIVITFKPTGVMFNTNRRNS